MAAKSSKKELYGIGAVAKLTGLTDHTIRVWERRYSAVVAERAANGRRVYSPADVEKLGLLKRLTDEGLSISQIAGDTIEALRERTQSMADYASAPVPDHIGVAILGDFLPAQFAAHQHAIEPIEIVVADNNRDRFMADLTGQHIDVVVLESPVLDSHVCEQLAECVERAGASRGVIVYSFGRVRDIDFARDSRIAVLRSPVNVEDVRVAAMHAYTPAAPARSKRSKETNTTAPTWHSAEPVAPRRFNNVQLTNLAEASSTIDCECPQHLAQLVGDLTAFEVYSAKCANRDEDDAALHRYLHQTTAEARALVETALKRVAEAEGIEY